MNIISLYKNFVFKKGTNYWIFSSVFTLFPFLCALFIIILDFQFKHETKILTIPDNTQYYLPYNGRATSEGIEFEFNQKPYRADCASLFYSICKREYANTYLKGQDIVFLQISYSDKLVKGIFIGGKMLSPMKNNFYNLTRDDLFIEKMVNREKNARYMACFVFFLLGIYHVLSLINCFLCLKFRSD